jgi:excisionase family DNA binding protein
MTRRPHVRDPGPAVPRLITVQELAELLQVPPKTLYSWRYRGEGPRGIMVGRHLRYRPQEVAAWLEMQMEPLRHGNRS